MEPELIDEDDLLPAIFHIVGCKDHTLLYIFA